MTAVSLKRVFMLPLALVLMSVPVRAQHVDVDYDRTVNFKAFKTYAIGTVKMEDDANPLNVQRTVSALESRMAFLGFQKVEKNPDVIVALQSSTREELVYYNWGGYGPYWWGPYPYGGAVAYPYGWGGGYGGVEQITIRTLILDMTDARTEKAVFRATAEDKVSHKARKNEKRAYNAVAEIFDKSPWGREFDED